MLDTGGSVQVVTGKGIGPTMVVDGKGGGCPSICCG